MDTDKANYKYNFNWTKQILCLVKKKKIATRVNLCIGNDFFISVHYLIGTLERLKITVDLNLEILELIEQFSIVGYKYFRLVNNAAIKTNLD